MLRKLELGTQFYNSVGSVSQACYYSFNGTIILLAEHMVKPAGASSDFMRVWRLWLSLGKERAWESLSKSLRHKLYSPPTSTLLHTSLWFRKPALSVSNHKVFFLSFGWIHAPAPLLGPR
jgi:hypothetical protein